MNRNSKKSKSLLALSSAAMALPAMTPSISSGAQPTESTLGYRYTQYRESSLSIDELANDPVDGTEGTNGSTGRYEIDVHQLAMAGPMGSKWSYSVALQHETLAGASPWYTVQNEMDGTVDVVMSGASIEDDRSDINSALTYWYDGGSFTGNFAYSTEDDYESVAFGISGEKEFDNKQTAVSAGISFSDDEIDIEDNALLYNNVFGGPYIPLDGPFPEQKFSKESTSTFISISRVLSPVSQVLTGLSYTKKSGFLSDAYKRYDIRPQDREQFTWNLSYRRWSKALKSAWHFDYRYYGDDWGVGSNTLTIANYKTFNKLQVIPSFRYYTQTAADFYFPFQQFDPGTGGRIQYNYYSDDARLSDYGALSFGLKFVLMTKKVNWVFGGEYYNAEKDIRPGSSSANKHPGMIEFTRFTLGADYKF